MRAFLMARASASSGKKKKDSIHNNTRAYFFPQYIFFVYSSFIVFHQIVQLYLSFFWTKVSTVKIFSVNLFGGLCFIKAVILK